MNDLMILGTDTDAGKTTFALLWMAALTQKYDYWKPLETGESDSDRVCRLVPGAIAHRPLLAFEDPVAPLLAARSQSVRIPSAHEIAEAKPSTSRSLLVESFGSPFSPLNETELQIELIRALDMSCVLVTSTAVGAIGRSLQCLQALSTNRIVPIAVILIGKNDSFAMEQIKRHWGHDAVFGFQSPSEWNAHSLAETATASLDDLLKIRSRNATPTFRHRTPDAGHRTLQLDRETVWHPYTSLGGSSEPLVCVGAQDEFLYLANGRRVIDGISSWWTILHGHRHPVLMAALAEASQKFDHVHFAGITHEPAVVLAELMLQTMPWLGGRVFYSDNGSTAVEVALKMAYQFWCHRGEPKRTRFISFEGGYHGDTFGAMAVGRDPLFFGRFEPLLFQASVVGLSADQLDAELIKWPGEIAAVIIEPLVQGAGGMRMHSPQTLRELFEVTRRHDVLFIADEVMTGCRRTGTQWAHQQAPIAPDLICAGKTLAGGVLPLAATMVAPKVVETFNTADASKTFFHGHSFTAHPLACAVAVTNWLELLDLPESCEAPARMERFWIEALSPLRDLSHVSDMRVRGSIAAVELKCEGGYLASAGKQVREICLKHDVLLRPLGNVVYAMPPLLTSQESLERIAEAIKAAVSTL